MTDGHGSGLRARVRAFRQRREPSDERGISLVEILIGVVVLGGLTVAMVGSLYTISVVSDQQRNISVAEAEGRRLVEQIRALQYLKCPADADDPDQTVHYPLVFNPANGSGLVSARITSIRYWDGQGLSATSGRSEPVFSSTCTRDCGLQEISLRVTADDSTSSFVFYKRNEMTESDLNCLS